MTDENSLIKKKLIKRKVINCKECGRFLCFVYMNIEGPPIGGVAEVQEVKCRNKKCKGKNSFSILIEDRPPDDQKDKAAN